MDSKVASPPLPPLFPLAGTAPPTPEDLARLYAELAEFRAANTRQAAALHTAELKIQALTLELPVRSNNSESSGLKSRPGSCPYTSVA